MSDNVSVRRGTVSDSKALALLKIEWAQLREPVSPVDADLFAHTLVEWMDRLGDNLVCHVAEVNDRIIGMAWLVIFDRVPDFGTVHRVSGDVQSVYVAPEFRSAGVGAQLMTAICEEADRLGIPRVLVHSSSTAIPFYKKLGFESLARLLARPLKIPL